MVSKPTRWQAVGNFAPSTLPGRQTVYGHWNIVTALSCFPAFCNCHIFAISARRPRRTPGEMVHAFISVTPHSGRYRRVSAPTRPAGTFRVLPCLAWAVPPCPTRMHRQTIRDGHRSASPKLIRYHWSGSAAVRLRAGMYSKKETAAGCPCVERSASPSRFW